MNTYLLAALTLTSALSAGNVKSVNGPPCDPCCDPDPCAGPSSTWPCRGPRYMITPSVGPYVSRGMNVNFSADFIYWTAREDQLSFVTRQPFDENSSAIEGSVSQPDWEYTAGFKVGAGIFYCFDGWDINACYTYLRPCTSKKTVHADENETLTLRPQTLPFEIDTLSSVSAQWSLEFNSVDLELGRNFYISRCLKLRPHFGLKGTWQKQEFPIRATSLPQPDLFYDFTNKLDYWGVGIRTGLDTSWLFSPCFSLVGEVAASALWEGYKTKRKVTRFEPEFAFTDFSGDCHRINPVLELLLGLRWETWFCCDAYRFAVDGGWEMQWWHGQNQFTTLQGPNLLGSLYLQGLSLKFRFDF